MHQIPRNLSDLQRLVDGVPRPALPEDVRVAERYNTFGDKGPLMDGHRRTILTAQTRYTIGDEVRVVHVYEVQAEGVEMEAMGPKHVYGEYLDEAHGTLPAPVGGVYDGPRVLSPAVDFFFDVTTYQFDAPGDHTLYWQPDDVRSNTVRITITSEVR
jgi:hypothetical protein